MQKSNFEIEFKNSNWRFLSIVFSLKQVFDYQVILKKYLLFLRQSVNNFGNFWKEWVWNEVLTFNKSIIIIIIVVIIDIIVIIINIIITIVIAIVINIIWGIMAGITNWKSKDSRFMEELMVLVPLTFLYIAVPKTELWLFFLFPRKQRLEMSYHQGYK